ncbi:cytochrome P450 [Nocardia testacea]|uniref:cytochrome P450 n=1 Tax=Nocardia testacea TaxID=248551 RepID=UPI003C2F7952
MSRRADRDAERPPGTRPLPLIGDLAAFARDQFGFLSSLHRRFGDVAEWSLGSTRVVVLFHPDDVGLVFAAAGANGPLGRGQDGTFARHAEITGNRGLILSEGSYWRRQRRTLQPGMHSRWIEGYAEVIGSFAEEFVLSWRLDQTRDVQQDMEQLVGRIAMKTLLGSDLGDEMAERLKRASDRMLTVNMLEFALGSKLPVWVPTPLRHWLKSASTRMDRLIMAAVEQRLAERETQAVRSGKDMLDMLLDARDEDGQPLTDLQLRDEIYTLYLAGYETTANTLGIALTLLSRRPDLQQRLVDEVERATAGGALGYEHVGALELAEAVVKETLRVYPVVRALNHRVNSTFSAGGYEFGPGHLVWVAPCVTQRDPRWFDAPDEFRPDRWLDGSTDAIPRFAWFPFGGGPRVCLGQRLAVVEMVLIMATVLRRFALSPADGESEELSLRINGGGHLVCTNARVILSGRPPSENPEKEVSQYA